MPVMPVLANGGTYIKPFLETSAKYFFGDQPYTPLASKRGLAPSQSTAPSSLTTSRKSLPSIAHMPAK